MESVGHQPREETRMIDVRVREHDGVQRRGMNRERSPVSPPQLLESLELPAIDQDALAIHLEQIFRAGHRARSTEKRQRCHRHTLLECKPGTLDQPRPRTAPAIIDLSMKSPAFDSHFSCGSLFSISCGSAQTRRLTIDDLYDPS